MHFLSPVLLLGLFAVHAAHGLRFAHNPVSVDTEVLIVNRPAKLTCNYVKYRTESVREITWFMGYSGFRSKIFHYAVTTGQKEGSVYPFVKTDESLATDSSLVLTLTEFRDPNMTFGCEVEVIRDNGYGKLRHSKKLGESPVSVVNSVSHQLLLSPDPGMGRQATPGGETRVTCATRGAEPPPKISIMVAGRNITDVYTGDAVPLDDGYGLVGSIVQTPIDLFEENYLSIECLAHFDDFLFDKKKISLKQNSQGGVYTSPTYNSNKARNSRPPPTSDRYVSSRRSWEHEDDDEREHMHRERSGRLEEGYEADVIHARLFDMVDPARHVHPGIPYDFFSGYLLMMSDKLDADNTNAFVFLLGEIPYEVEASLNRNYGRINQISPGKVRIKMGPAKVLNILGGLGYRVVSASPAGEQNYVWTMEKKNFDMAKNNN